MVIIIISSTCPLSPNLPRPISKITNHQLIIADLEIGHLFFFQILKCTINPIAKAKVVRPYYSESVTNNLLHEPLASAAKKYYFSLFNSS